MERQEGTPMSSTLAMPARRGRNKQRRPYAPGHYPRTKVLSVQARHLVNRFSFGITPALVEEVKDAGGHLAWFERQLATAYDLSLIHI